MNVNKGYTAFIVDDNPAALETLATDLRQQPEFAEVYTFASYAEATLPLLEKQPDVLFLDVEVPGKTGFEFLDSIRSKVTFTFKVVFYTSFSDYMIDAIRQSAFDYLLKPYKQSELRLIIDRMKQSENERVLQRIGSDAMQRKIAMQTVRELLLINLDEALMFNYSSERRSWVLTLTDGTVHVLKKGVTADDLANFSQTMVHISNTCIINLNYLAAVENNTQHCRLCPPFDNIEITASRRYFSKLKERLDLL